MKEAVILLMACCIGVMWLALVAFDRWNEQLRRENRELRKRLREKKGENSGD